LTIAEDDAPRSENVTWGVSLYADDSAADLRKTMGALADMPVSGERLLEILLANHHDSAALEDSGGPTFWLVTADQFERRGIRCAEVFEKAKEIAATGADHRDFESRGASPADLRKRDAVVAALIERISHPRPERPLPRAKKPPPFVVEVGQVYSFPIMGISARNPYGSEGTTPWFEPDGWGAMLVALRRRVFDWIPVCGVASLTVEAIREPTLDDALAAQVVDPCSLCVPRRSHLKHMRAKLLGAVDLDPAAAAALMPVPNGREPIPETPENAAVIGWTFHVFGRQSPGTGSTPVADLVRQV
jgi:hypothetical protein